MLTGKTRMDDKINPEHYTQGIECIDYVTSKNMSFLEGNVVKYVTRYKMKNGLEDLEKAQWYLTRLIRDYNKKGEVK
jgi:hypothetical protein